jgi:hypothetical protein
VVAVAVVGLPVAAQVVQVALEEEVLEQTVALQITEPLELLTQVVEVAALAAQLLTVLHMAQVAQVVRA